MELNDSDFAKDLCKRPFIDKKTLGLQKDHPMIEPSTENHSDKKEDMQKHNRKNKKDVYK